MTPSYSEITEAIEKASTSVLGGLLVKIVQECLKRPFFSSPQFLQACVIKVIEEHEAEVQQHAHPRIILPPQQPDGHFKVVLQIEYPERRKVLAIERRLSANTFECLQPLPLDHDVPFMFASTAQAQQQRQERERKLKYLGELLAQELGRMIQQQDPVMGRPPEEKQP